MTKHKPKPITANTSTRADLFQVGRDAAYINVVGHAFLGAGGEILKRDYDLTTEQVQAWASQTIDEAGRVLRGQKKPGPGETK